MAPIAAMPEANAKPAFPLSIAARLRSRAWLVGAISGGVPAFLSVVDTVAGLAIAAGATYFAFRLIVLAKRRLLWRVRRKMILSYIFVGFVPALLIVAFFLLCGFLLFYNFSSYLVQSRLHALADRARFIAQSTALEIQRAGGRDVPGIVARRQSAQAEELPELSMAVVPADRSCAGSADVKTLSDSAMITAGPWRHLDPPRAIPGWVPCSGFS